MTGDTRVVLTSGHSQSDIASVKDDVREIKQRLSSLEAAVAGLRRVQANLYGDMSDQHARYDRLAERVERIERRLDLHNEG